MDTAIHALIEGDYLSWEDAGAGNTRLVEQPVLVGHQSDLVLENNLGNITRTVR
nr:hypothetical protein [uncultured Draconibacterium sp.]